MDIYLLRHGVTTHPGTYSGCSDVHLSDEGRNQILALRPFFSKLTFDQCYCSPLSRCRETYELLDMGLPCTIDNDLREIDFGRWEGLSFAEIEKRFSDQLEKWVEQQDNFQFPGGDLITAFNDRICGWFDKLLTKEHEHVCIVSHGGVLRIGLCHLLGFDHARAFAFHIKEGCVSRLTIKDGHGRLDQFNCGSREHCHG